MTAARILKLRPISPRRIGYRLPVGVDGHRAYIAFVDRLGARADDFASVGPIVPGTALLTGTALLNCSVEK